MASSANAILDQFRSARPIFVVGASRSGTTLLQLMLNAHPRIALQGELAFFSQILQVRRHIPRLKTEEDIEGCLAFIRRTEAFSHLPDGPGLLRRVHEKLRSVGKPGYGLLYFLLIQDLAEQDGKSRIGEKTPENVRYIPEIRKVFPKSRIIHLVRDPRAVVRSLLQVPWASDDVAVTTLKWRADVSFGREHSDAPWYAEVRYEDLVRNPERSLRRICQFVGEPYDSQMLKYHEDAEEYFRNEPWKVNTTKPPARGSIDKWRTDLAPGQVALVELLAGRVLTDLGYSRTTRWRSRLLSVATTLPSELYRYARYRFRSRKSDGPQTIVGENMIVLRLLMRMLTRR